MSRFRSHWLALFGAVTLIALSLSTAFGARPEGENRGQQVSAFVHSLVGADEETEEDTEVEEDTDTEEDTEVEEEEEESAPSDHGQCVALVAQDKEAVGPPNDNHGGAVSEAARVTCRDTGDEESGTESEGTEDADSASAPEHGKGHGHGHNK